ncbi:MAG: hypothetical protein GY870_06850, partial [archaeon]|nr:hypothetical protein [archaeon]
MIKENFKIEKEEKKVYPPLPENIYQVELLDVNVENRATYDTRNNQEEEKIYENVLKFQFTLLSGKNGEEDLRGRNVWENFVQASLYIGKKGKNKLYQIVESLIGRDLTREEEATFHSDKLNNLIGKQCRIGIKHRIKDNATYDNIDAYYASESEQEKLSDKEKEDARVKDKSETIETINNKLEKAEWANGGQPEEPNDEISV